MAVGMLGTVATVLAALGLAAVVGYTLTLRTREIGVRLAIGASTRDVMRLVFRQAGGLTVAGLVGGLVLAVPLAFALRALLVGVSPLDPVAIAVPAMTLCVTGLVAAWLPARRASRVDPATALREG